MKTFVLVSSKVQVWVQVWAPAGHLAINPKGYLRRLSKVWNAKSMAELLGQHSGTACARWMGKHKHRVFPSLLQSLRAATGLLEEKALVPPLWLSSRVKKLCKFQAVNFFFQFEMKFLVELAGSCYWPKQCSLPGSIFPSFIGLAAKTLLRNIPRVPKQILCKASDLNLCPVCKNGVCSDLNGTSQQLQMEALKSLETMSDMIPNQLQPKLKPIWLQMKCHNWKPCSFILRFWAIYFCKQ